MDLARVRAAKGGRISVEDVEAAHAREPRVAPRSPATAAMPTRPRSAVADASGDRRADDPVVPRRPPVLRLLRRRHDRRERGPDRRRGVLRRRADLGSGAHAARPSAAHDALRPEGLIPADGIHLGIAVALDEGCSCRSFATPTRRTSPSISRERAALQEGARAGKLPVDALVGAVFTISNLGQQGVDRFTAIVNPPEAAILAVGRVRDLVVARDGVVVVAPVVTLTLSVDHRVVDGAPAAAFLADLAAPASTSGMAGRTRRPGSTRSGSSSAFRRRTDQDEGTRLSRVRTTPPSWRSTRRRSARTTSSCGRTSWGSAIPTSSSSKGATSSPSPTRSSPVTSGPVRSWKSGNVKDLAPGDRVVGECVVGQGGRDHFGFSISGAAAELFRARGEWLHRIPDQLSYTQAALVEPFSVAYNATLCLGGVDPSDTIAVIGSGPIGLLAIMAAAANNARVVVIEPKAGRREKALDMGAMAALDPTQRIVQGRCRRPDRRARLRRRDRGRRAPRRPWLSPWRSSVCTGGSHSSASTSVRRRRQPLGSSSRSPCASRA